MDGLELEQEGRQAQVLAHHQPLRYASFYTAFAILRPTSTPLVLLHTLRPRQGQVVQGPQTQTLALAQEKAARFGKLDRLS